MKPGRRFEIMMIATTSRPFRDPSFHVCGGLDVGKRAVEALQVTTDIV
jgi:hypothetical protein